MRVTEIVEIAATVTEIVLLLFKWMSFMRDL